MVASISRGYFITDAKSGRRSLSRLLGFPPALSRTKRQQLPDLAARPIFTLTSDELQMSRIRIFLGIAVIAAGLLACMFISPGTIASKTIRADNKTVFMRMYVRDDGLFVSYKISGGGAGVTRLGDAKLTAGRTATVQHNSTAGAVDCVLDDVVVARLDTKTGHVSTTDELEELQKLE
ncbi:MAG: hypothetical protein U0795_14620 [Pirellulales bacterium]